MKIYLKKMVAEFVQKMVFGCITTKEKIVNVCFISMSIKVQKKHFCIKLYKSLLFRYWKKVLPMA